jgi:Protein tyrosine/serine phosphatase
MPKQNRTLKLEGCYNFRDLGGYPVQGGGKTVWGKVYRADDLSRLTDNDLVALSRLGIKTYIDFRDKFETKQRPDKVAPGVLHVQHLSIDTAQVMEIFSSDVLTGETAEKQMRDIYASLANDFTDQYRRFFACLANSSNAPLVFHCLAGKDRTGFGAALFLAALGVDDQTIFDDYMISSKNLAEVSAKWAKTEAHKALLGVRRSYLESAFKSIEGNYGGMKNYLERALGVDTAALRVLYTERA